MAQNETRVDKILGRLKNHPLVAVFVVLSVVIIGLATLKESLGKLIQPLTPTRQDSTVAQEPPVVQFPTPTPVQHDMQPETPEAPTPAEATSIAEIVRKAELKEREKDLGSAGPISAPPATPANPAESPSEERAFEADTYRLTVDTARMTDGKIAVTLIIHNTSSEGVYFEATDWYLVDESGNQWFPYRLSKVISKLPGFQSEKAKEGLRQMDPLQQRIYIAAGTRFRGDIVFKSSNSDIGREFTLVAFEKKPIHGREIVVRGISVEE